MKIDLFNAALLLGIFNAGLLVVGGLLWWRGDHLLKRGIRIRATIVEYVYKRSNKSGHYVPVVQFLTEKQQLITQQLRWRIFTERRIGKKLDIIYDPSEPTNIMVDQEYTMVIIPRVLVVLGIAGVIFEVLLAAGVVPLPR